MTKTMKYIVLPHAAPAAPYRGTSQAAADARKPAADPASDGPTRPTPSRRQHGQHRNAERPRIQLPE